MAALETICDPSDMVEVELTTIETHEPLCLHHTESHTIKTEPTVKKEPKLKTEVKLVTDLELKKEIKVKTEPTVTKTIVTKRKQRSLRCVPCDFTAKSRKNFKRHIQGKKHIAKSRVKDHQCNLCNAKELTDLKKCPQCNYTSDNIASLKLHLNIHNKGSPFRCNLCPYAAQNIKLLIEHFKSVTKYCTKGSCKFSTHVEDELKKHKKVCKW